MSGKKFRFSLRSVLDLREHETQRAQQGLARAIEAREVQERRVQERRRALSETGADQPEKVCQIQRLRQHAAFCEEARRAHRTAREHLDSLCQREETARAELRQKQQAEEGLQKLREQEREAHEKEQRAQEEAFLDEQAALRFSREQPSFV